MRLFYLLMLIAILFAVDLSAKVAVRRSSQNRVVFKQRAHSIGWNWRNYGFRSLGWPSYYAYYGYPIQDSIYYYSYPLNSTYYYSYPSVYRNWTYPSYPYVGKYYINSTPYPAARLMPNRPNLRISRPRFSPPSTPVSFPEQPISTSVFFGE